MTDFDTIQIKRGSSANWTTNSSMVLASGEIGFEFQSGISRFKIGDGTSAWSVLPYYSSNNTSMILNIPWNQAYGTTTSQILLNNSTANRIDFNTSGVNTPTATTRSVGTKIVLYPAVGIGSATDAALGISSVTMWNSIPDSGWKYSWYAASDEIASLSGTGTLMLGKKATAQTTGIYFNSSGLSLPSYDCAVWSVGGSSTTGTGNMYFDGSTFNFNGIVNVGATTTMGTNYVTTTNFNGTFNGALKGSADNSGGAGTSAGGGDFVGYTGAGNSTGTSKVLEARANSTSTRYIMGFTNPNGQVGTITTSGTATAFNTSSDYRLKENDVPMENSINRVMSLRPIRFNFKAEPNKTVDGFFAHEVQNIVPEAVTGEKDAVNDFGDPDYQGIDQSKLVPLLTAALQDLVRQNLELASRIEQLENKVSKI